VPGDARHPARYAKKEPRQSGALDRSDMSDQCARRPTTSLRLALWSRGPGLAAQPGRNRGTARPPFHADRRELAGRRSGMVLRLDRSVILCSKTKRRAVSGKNRQIRTRSAGASCMMDGDLREVPAAMRGAHIAMRL